MRGEREWGFPPGSRDSSRISRGLLACLRPGAHPLALARKRLVSSSNQAPWAPSSSRSEARPTDGDQAASSPPGILRKTLTVRTTLQVYSLIHSLTHSIPRVLAPALGRGEQRKHSPYVKRRIEAPLDIACSAYEYVCTRYSP